MPMPILFRRRLAACACACLFGGASLSLVALPAHANEEGGPAISGPVFYRLAPISFSVIGPDNRISKIVAIALQLEVMPGKTELALEPFGRRFQDAFLLTLSDMWETALAQKQEVSADAVKSRLLQEATHIAGPGLVKSVLITGLSERRDR